MKKKKRKSSLKSLRDKCWRLMSEYSRRKDAKNDLVVCVTCGKIDRWNSGSIHAGHFFHGSKQRPISYDDRNIHAQCSSCNTYKGGARDHYAVYISKRYGPQVLEELETLKHQGKEMKRLELEEMICLLEARLDELNKRCIGS